MHANLVLAARLELQFHERAHGVRVGLEQAPVGHGKAAAFHLHGAALHHIGAGVVAKPTLHTAFALLGNALYHCHITAVKHAVVPPVLHLLLDVDALGIEHQARGATIEAMHHMGGATLVSEGEMAVEKRFHVQALRAHRHREHTRLLVNHDDIGVLVDNRVKLAVAGSAHRGAALHLHHATGFQHMVMTCHHLAVDAHATMGKNRLRLVTSNAVERLHYEIEQRHGLAHGEHRGAFMTMRDRHLLANFISGTYCAVVRTSAGKCSPKASCCWSLSISRWQRALRW